MITFQCRSITTAGKGSWWASMLLERCAHLPQLLRVEPGLAVERREAGGQQHLVALAERHVERARQRQHHLAARVGAPALHEADVARSDARLAGQRELAHPPLLPPVLEQRADRAGGHGRGLYGRAGRAALLSEGIEMPPCAAHPVGHERIHDPHSRLGARGIP